jgi:putative salt-induced outer membrane protein YdiY
MKKFFVVLMAVAFMFIMKPTGEGVASADWSGDMTVGLKSVSGNSNGSALSLSAKASKTDGDERYTVSGGFDYSKESDVLTARKSRGSLQYDKFITPKVYALLNIELSKDEIRNIDMLTTIGPGFGYQLSDSLRFEGGFAYNDKNVSMGEDEQWTTARLSMYSKDNFTDSLSLSNLLTWNPSLEDFGDYTLRNKLDLAYAFTDKWSGKLTQLINYDKTPSPGVDPLDKTLMLSFQYSL